MTADTVAPAPVKLLVSTPQETIDRLYRFFVVNRRGPSYSDDLKFCVSYDSAHPPKRCAVACLVPLPTLLAHANPDTDYCTIDDRKVVGCNPRPIIRALDRVLCSAKNQQGRILGYCRIQSCHDASAHKARLTRQSFVSLFSENLRALCVGYNLTYPGDRS